MQNLLFILSLLFIVGLQTVQADETPWPVPDDQKNKVAPFVFDNNSQKVGQELYLKNCKSCHGDIGQANMIPLNPLPKDLSIEAVSSQSDASIYYKITTGRVTMPSFKNTLSVNDKWNVISYIRSFHKGYVQPAPINIEAFAGAITLQLDWDKNEKQLKVFAQGKENEVDVPAEGVEVALFAERYFGQLKLGDAKITNKEGIASFSIEGKLPGDSVGALSLIAKVVDVDSYGEVSAKAEFIAGDPTIKPGLTEKRAMWNVRSKAPWWLSFAYPGVVLAVLATIGYIALLLKKVNDIGKNE